MNNKQVKFNVLLMVAAFTFSAGINNQAMGQIGPEIDHESFAMSAKNVFAERLKQMARFSGGVMKPKNKGSFVRTVGPEPGCHFSGIQAAINGSLSGDTVAVVGSVSWDEHLLIQDKSINLIGGYNSCEDAINNPESNLFKVTELDFGDPATETQAGITVLSVNSDVVSIQNFAIKNLNREASAGGMLVAGNVALFMEKVEILNNRATRGGGIEVNGSLGPIINMRHTLISGNAATTGSGGGIYAAGGPGLIIMDGDSALANNRANFHGGGAHISGGNLLAFASGNPNSYNSNKTAATFFENGVYGNRAEHFQNINEVTRGGAFYVINGGLLALVGDEFNGVINADGVVNMYDNFATQGGAVYVSGQDSQVYAQGVLGHENVASVAAPESSSGGFAHVSDQATFNFIGRLDEGNINCWDPVKCSWLVDNQSLSGENDQGGAITAEGGAQVTISGVRFEQNLSNVGQAISLAGLGTLLHLENSEVVRHGIDGFPGESTIHLTDGARMNSLHNTIVNNKSSSSIIRATMGISFDTGFSDFSSIIYNQAAHDSDVYSGDMAGGVFDCLITHDPNIDASFNGQLLRTNVFDTAMLAFQDIENGLFDLTDQSLAIDYCDDSNISDLISISDIKGAVRGNDGPAIGLHGLYDVGAHAYQNTVPGISVINEGGLITSEPDVSDELQFFLDTSPAIDSAVILDLSVDNDEAVVTPTQLIFTSENFQTPIVVTVTGEDDDEFDGNQNYVITAAISGTDPAYTNLEDPVIGGLNLDDDAQILINPSEGLVTTESGATDSFEVALTLPPAPGIDNNVKVIFSNFDLSEGLLSVNELVFTSNNWLDPQTVTIFPQDDFEVDGDQDYTIVTTVESGDAKYEGLNVVDVQVMNLDDDNAIVVAPFDFLETTEAGGQAQFDVYLQAQPTEPVFVHLNSLDESEGVVNFEVLEFTSQSWGIESAQTVTVTGVDDPFDDGDIMYSIETTVITDDPFFNGYNPEDVQLTNLDDDEPNDLAGLAISPSSGLETTELGGLANYSVVLTSQPTGMVTVKSASLDSEEGIVTSGGSLQFTADNWNEPQIVTVTGQDDEFDDGDVAYAVSVSVESEDVQYNGMDVPQVQLTNIDDDEETAAGLAAIVLSKSSGIETSEDGQEDVVLVSLASSPGVDLVTVNFSIADVYSDEVAMPVSALEFDQFNWNVPIEVVIAGVDDLVVDGDVMYSINVNTTASNPASPYHNLAAQIAGVNSDNDRGVLVKPGYDGFLKTEENGDNKQFTMVMTAAPVNDVIVSVESQDLTEGVLDVSEVVFTPDNWSVIQAVNVTPQDDDVMDGSIFYNIKTTLSTTDPLINSEVVDVTVINDDDELVPGAPALVVNPSSGLVTYETGITPDRFLVTLGTAPSAPVNVSVAVSDESEAEVNKQNFVLDNGNWDTGVWVIVNGLDDSAADGDQEYSIAVSTESSDSDYDQLVELVLGINIDDEMPTLPATLVLSNTESLTTTETGNVASFKVALNGMPSSDVIINVLTEDDTEGEVQTNQIIFNDNNWNVATDVFIAGLDDDEFDGDIVYAVRLIITSDDEAYAALDDTLVLLTNLDDENENAGVAGVVISQTSGLLTDEDGLTDQFDIRLASEPAGSVTMTLTSNNETEGLVSPTEIEFNANNWNQSIPVTLTGQDDQAFDGNQDYTVSISVDSDDPNYDGLEVDDVKATNHDNEIANGPGVALTQQSLITSEDGGQLGSDQFEIFLTSQPISPVTITLVSSDENEAVVNPAIIELNGANWNVPTAITVTGVDDGDLVDGDAPYMISLTAESLDPDYDELAIDDIVGLNLDNDSPGNGCEEPSPMNDPDIIYKTGFECIVE